MTIYEQNAALAANRDRALTADLVLDLACKQATDLIAGGHAALAVQVLTYAGRSAERILGRQGRAA